MSYLRAAHPLPLALTTIVKSISTSRLAVNIALKTLYMLTPLRMVLTKDPLNELTDLRQRKANVKGRVMLSA